MSSVVAPKKLGSPGMSISVLIRTLLKMLFGFDMVNVVANKYASVLKNGNGSKATGLLPMISGLVPRLTIAIVYLIVSGVFPTKAMS